MHGPAEVDLPTLTVAGLCRKMRGIDRLEKGLQLGPPSSRRPLNWPFPTTLAPCRPPFWLRHARIESGWLPIQAGDRGTLGDVTYRCAAGGEDCTVTVKDGKATYTGGTVTGTVSDGFAAINDLDDTEAELEDREGELEDTQGRLSVSQRVNHLFWLTAENLKTASDAKRKAEKAPGQATEASKTLTMVQVKGESSKAMASAQVILSAHESLSDEVVKRVRKAISDLKARKTTAGALPSTAPERTRLIATINSAIQEAEACLAIIQAIKAANAAGPGTVAALAVDIINNGDGTAAAWAEKVAVEVEKAATPYIGKTKNLPMNTGGITGKYTAGIIDSEPEGFYTDDIFEIRTDEPPEAKTWRQILGEDKIIERERGLYT